MSVSPGGVAFVLWLVGTAAAGMWAWDHRRRGYWAVLLWITVWPALCMAALVVFLLDEIDRWDQR